MKRTTHYFALMLTVAALFLTSVSVFASETDELNHISKRIDCHTTAEDGIYDDDNVKIPK